METKAFVAKLIADATDQESHILSKIDEFKLLLQNLKLADQGSFSLKVLCVLCRNLEKVPSWGDNINNKELLTLGIECLRHTRSLDKSDQVKILACTFHMHRHVITKSTSTPPELALKLSYMPFESDCLISEHFKTYALLIGDRLTYIEKLKSKISALKLLPKLIEDITKVTKIYDIVQFCTSMLTFLVKKLHSVYNEYPGDVNEAIKKIFNSLSNNDLRKMTKLSEKEALDLYVKLNECLCIVTGNSLKINFKKTVLDAVTRVSLSLLGHRSDMFQGLQAVYLNFACIIFSDKANPMLIKNILNSVLDYCEMSEKLGYKYTIHATYPFISQLLKLYMDYYVNNKKNLDEEDILNAAIQENCLKLVIFLLEKLKKTNQFTKCQNCSVKSGLHDALQLSFCVIKFLTLDYFENQDTINVPIYFTIVDKQYSMLEQLKDLGCPNYDKCFQKLQTDVHNMAVWLNKNKKYEYSIKLFNSYLTYELKNLKNDTDLKKVSRALYNKSICESDCNLYHKSLRDAYLSFILSLPDSLNSEKYMSLVIDIKTKALKNLTKVDVCDAKESLSSDEDSDEANGLQFVSILQACTMVYEDESCENIRIFLKDLQLSPLLKHEFSMYVKLWPSLVPLAGVCRSLHRLAMGKSFWSNGEDKEVFLNTLYEVVLETPTVARTIHDDRYKNTVLELVKGFEESPPITRHQQVVYGSLLILKSEYDMAEASQKYNWKATEHTVDPDRDGHRRTMREEYSAIGAAVLAVQVLSDALHNLPPDAVPHSILAHTAQIMCMCTQQLLHMHMTAQALQLAYIGCDIADLVGKTQLYLRNASVLLYHSGNRAALEGLASKAVSYAARLVSSGQGTDGQSTDAALCLLCDAAMYYVKRGRLSIASRLVQYVQVKILDASNKDSDKDLDLSLGKLMEAQAMLCGGSGLSMLSAVNGLHKHYLAARNTASRWCTRRAASLHIKTCIALHGARSVSAARRLLLWRRARCSAAVALPGAAAASCARVLVHITNTHGPDADEKINSRLKYIVGLPASDEVGFTPIMAKQTPFTPKQTGVETMLDSAYKRAQFSPTMDYPVPAFQMPEFLLHAKSCECYACMQPACLITICQICHLEASMYYRKKEHYIARTYFDGAIKCFTLAETKLKNIFDLYKNKNRNHPLCIDIAKEMVEEEFKTAQLEFLIELTYFELSQNELQKSDEHIVAIHEILVEIKDPDPYLSNEVSNLKIASARMRINKPVKVTGLEDDLDDLKLSPNAILKTPESKTMPKVATPKLVSPEALPRKFKGSKLNLDYDPEEDVKENTDTNKLKPKRTKFKEPVPVNQKPVLEAATPRPSRTIPEIKITKTSSTKKGLVIDSEQDEFKIFDDSITDVKNTKKGTVHTKFKAPVSITEKARKLSLVNKLNETDLKIATPKTVGNNEQFYTPCQSTPAEQFFTPMTSQKTYTRTAVKNLEKEFSTPVSKEESSHQPATRSRGSKVETGSLKNLKADRALRRAVSPGKLEDSKPKLRTSRK